ncbi:hypothetical protein [Urechidicola vernalis]|uniref:Uncharacterized protein n=1 Tax=Urechidicola vernalis TaxID=3075600 RepID=A0ABU2Y792_9FLAO|nr:hypothetical protein [Urechidicola sp. P050]MDT0553562.1 hypothetical protein [Urechidicola sp. P050]
MKKLFLCCLLFIFSIQGVLGQKTELNSDNTPQELEEYYTMMHKKKRKTGNILLISGVSVLAVGGVLSVTTALEAGLIAAPLGAISCLASIPFYVKSKSYKRKARKVSSSFNVSIGTVNLPDSKKMSLGLSYNF